MIKPRPPQFIYKNQLLFLNRRKFSKLRYHLLPMSPLEKKKTLHNRSITPDITPTPNRSPLTHMTFLMGEWRFNNAKTKSTHAKKSLKPHHLVHSRRTPHMCTNCFTNQMWILVWHGFFLLYCSLNLVIPLNQMLKIYLPLFSTKFSLHFHFNVKTQGENCSRSILQ